MPRFTHNTIKFDNKNDLEDFLNICKADNELDFNKYFLSRPDTGIFELSISELGMGFETIGGPPYKDYIVMAEKHPNLKFKASSIWGDGCGYEVDLITVDHKIIKHYNYFFDIENDGSIDDIEDDNKSVQIESGNGSDESPFY